ncbi:condensation domain-containing protein, partial [Streptomyces sp. NPDC056373]|uniref:condensation domain-containing protein n=1 Tax=Streptomyces sp. NPDC056373 TaxID=3345798 RepID=UPI0035DBD7DA
MQPRWKGLGKEMIDSTKSSVVRAGGADAHLVEEWHPLSSAQEGLWFLYQLRPESRPTYNQAFCVRLRGALDRETLARALNRLTARHGMLRARFQEVDGRPRQSVAGSVEVPVSWTDVSGLSDDDIRDLAEDDYLRPFDLHAAPLIRASVFERGPEDRVLLVACDHLVGDGWSWWRLLRELGELVGEQRGGTAPHAFEPAGAGDYLAHARHQRDWLSQADGEKQFTYWKEALADATPGLDIATDRQRGRVRGSRRGVQPVRITGELVEAIRAFSRRHHATTFTTLLTGYAILLHRLSGQEAVAVGAPMPARGDGRWDEVVGNFMNPVALRAVFPPDLTVAGAVRQIRDTALRGLANQDFPLRELAERLNPARDADGNPFFSTMFVFQNPREENDIPRLMDPSPDAPTVTWAGMDATAFWCPMNGGAAFDLMLHLGEIGDHITGALEYSSDLFDASTVERFVGYFRAVLSAMVADEGRLVGDVPLLDAVEEHR